VLLVDGRSWTILMSLSQEVIVKFLKIIFNIGYMYMTNDIFRWFENCQM